MEFDLLEKNVEVKGPYYNAKNAAEYVGYGYDHFRHLTSECQVPRCGPRKNRYAVSVLDSWMKDPNCFKIKTFTNRKRVKKLEV